MNYAAAYDSPLGPMILVASDEALVGLYFTGQKYVPDQSRWHADPGLPVIRTAVTELDEYFAGTRETFDVPIAPAGTAFQRAVWDAISRVPYGETITYGELARRVGRPGSARAAGAATGQNPVGVIVPCHRIVGAGGTLTGYAGGLDRKRALLTLEMKHHHARLATAVSLR